MFSSKPQSNLVQKLVFCLLLYTGLALGFKRLCKSLAFCCFQLLDFSCGGLIIICSGFEKMLFFKNRGGNFAIWVHLAGHLVFLVFRISVWVIRQSHFLRSLPPFLLNILHQFFCPLKLAPFSFPNTHATLLEDNQTLSQNLQSV